MDPTTIGVLIGTDFEYGVAVLEGIREHARAHPGWRVLPLAHTQEALLARLLRSGGRHAIAGAFMSDRWLHDRLPAGTAAVNTAHLSRIESVSTAAPDDRAAGRLAARHFRDLGVTHAGLVAERATHAAHLRREGFLAEARAHGMAVSEPPADAGYRPGTGWAAWAAALPDGAAVFCTSDLLARIFWMACGIPVRQRLAALAGAGDSLTDRVASGVEISSVPLPARRVGQRAAAALARQLAGDTAVTHELVAPAELIVRASSRRTAVGDSVVARALAAALQIAHEPNVATVAAQVGVSRRTLELRFRAALGESPGQAFRRQRLREAARLLAETELSVAEVAARTGGGSVQAFTALFRRAHGSPPAAYRRHARRDGQTHGDSPPLNE